MLLLSGHVKRNQKRFWWAGTSKSRLAKW